MEVKALGELEKNLLKLVQDHGELKRDVIRLEHEKQALQMELLQMNEQLKSFQNQDKITKIARSAVDESAKSDEGNRELKLKINEYIKEIDKCILHLSE